MRARGLQTRNESLVNVCEQEPRRVAAHLIQEFYANDYSIVQRLLMLQVPYPRDATVTRPVDAVRRVYQNVVAAAHGQSTADDSVAVARAAVVEEGNRRACEAQH